VSYEVFHKHSYFLNVCKRTAGGGGSIRSNSTQRATGQMLAVLSTRRETMRSCYDGKCFLRNETCHHWDPSAYLFYTDLSEPKSRDPVEVLGGVSLSGGPGDSAWPRLLQPENWELAFRSPVFSLNLPLDVSCEIETRKKKNWCASTSWVSLHSAEGATPEPSAYLYPGAVSWTGEGARTHWDSRFARRPLVPVSAR